MVRLFLILFFGHVFAKEEEILSSKFFSAKSIIETTCGKPEFNKSQKMDCVAKESEDFYKKSQEGFKKLEQIAQDDQNSPLHQIKKDILSFDSKGDTQLKQARFVDSLVKLINKNPKILKEIPELDKFLSDYITFSGYRQTFRIGGLDKGQCVFPEFSHQDEYSGITTLKGKKCNEICHTIKKAKKDGSHIQCQPYKSGGKTSFEKAINKVNNDTTTPICDLNDPFLKDVPKCLGPLSSPPEGCNMDQMLNNIGLESEKGTIEVLMQAGGACTYLHTLRIKAVDELIKTYQKFVDKNVPIPPECKAHFSEQFLHQNKSPKEKTIQFKSKAYREELKGQAVVLVEKIKKIDSNSSKIKSLKAKLISSNFKEKFDTSLTFKEKRDIEHEISNLEDEINKSRKEVIETHSKYPYLAVRGSDESPFSLTKELTSIASTDSDAKTEKLLSGTSHHIGADILDSLKNFCDPQKTTGKDLVSNRLLVQSVLNGDQGLGQIPGYAEVQSCLSNVAGNQTLEVLGTVAVAGACLAAGLITSPTGIGPLIVGAGCSAINVGMSMEDYEKTKNKEEALRACLASNSLCDPAEYQEAFETLNETEETLYTTLGTEFISNAVPAAVLIKDGLIAIKFSGDVAKLKRTNASIKALVASDSYKAASKEQKMSLISKALEEEKQLSTKSAKAIDAAVDTSRSKEIAEIVMDNELLSLAKSFSKDPEEQNLLIEAMAELKKKFGNDKDKITEEFYKLVGPCKL